MHYPQVIVTTVPFWTWSRRPRSGSARYRRCPRHLTVQAGGGQHLAGKVGTLAADVRHFRVAAGIGIGVKIDGGALATAAPAWGYW